MSPFYIDGSLNSHYLPAQVMRSVALINVMHKRGCDGFYEKSSVHIHEIKKGVG